MSYSPRSALQPPLTLQGHDARADAGAFQRHLLDLADRRGLACSIAGDGLTLQIFGGSLRLAARDGLRIDIEAEDDSGLFRLQQFVLGLAQMQGQVLAPVWSRAWPGRQPPNLILAQVAAVEALSPGFRRLHLTGADFARFGASALHARLLLPPRGRAPVWPVLGEAGRTEWPEGADALHRPVYTFRAIDPGAGRAAIDIVLHEGGRVTDWSAAAAPGDAVGLMGPSGRAVPAVDWVALFGDATALPALARLLARLPATTRGHAFVHLHDRRDRQPLSAPEGVQIHWTGGADRALIEALQALPVPAASRHVWFSAEKSLAEMARAHLHGSLGLSRQETNVTAYWSRTSD